MNNFKLEKATKTFVTLLLTIDILFLILHYLNVNTDLISNKNYILNSDTGYPEMYQYIKEIWIIILLLILIIKLRLSMLFIWFLIFLYLFLDDFFYFHEKLGGILLGKELIKHSITNYQNAYHYGQLIYGTIVGVLFTIIIIFFYYFSSNDIKKLSKYLIFSLFILYLFAVLIDFFKGLSHWEVLNYLEEGGENILMSLITCILFNFNLVHKKAM